MTAKILDGRAVAALQRAETAKQIEFMIKAGYRKPSLAVILIGCAPASKLYVHNKRKACNEVGITSLAYDFPDSITQDKLLTLIHKLNQDPSIDGILIQLPLPAHINEAIVLESIDPRKDVDGFHPFNLGRLTQRNPALRPCTPYGVIKLLEHYSLALRGLNATVVGESNIVGRPMAIELLNAGCTVTICHRSTTNLPQAVSNAEILVVAVGKTGIIQTDWLKPNAIVIDIGIHHLADGRIVGDIDFATAKSRVSWLTPVPGGVGPMTVATLLSNTYQAAKNIQTIV